MMGTAHPTSLSHQQYILHGWLLLKRANRGVPHYSVSETN